MSMATELDVMMFHAAASAAGEMMGTILNERAAEYLKTHPVMVGALCEFRRRGKMDLSLAEVQGLVALGIVSADADGFYLSEVVEDLIDDIERRMKEIRAKKETP